MTAPILIAGVDEVGRGPLAGPVVAAAVILPAQYDLPGLTDSKKLSLKKRELLEPAVIEQAISWAVGWASAAEIDRINILQASLLAMRRALDGLSVRPTTALIDGNRTPRSDIPCRAIIGGDLSEPCISAASIIAKQHRDRYMAQLAEQYPAFGFAKHAGYPTKMHLEALKTDGICPEHRRSFGPVKRQLAVSE